MAMTLLEQRNAAIVKLNRVDGVAHRQVAKAVGVNASTVTRVLAQFRREMAVIVGDLSKFPAADLRDLTICLLDNAAKLRGQPA